jgi:hypothetical protein
MLLVICYAGSTLPVGHCNMLVRESENKFVLSFLFWSAHVAITEGWRSL